MIEELEDLLKPYGEHLNREYAHPAMKNLFTVNQNAKELSEDKVEIFRTFVAKILWTEKRG